MLLGALSTAYGKRVVCVCTGTLSMPYEIMGVGKDKVADCQSLNWVREFTLLLTVTSEHL